MKRRASTLSAAYFDRLYSTDPDPWRFATSDYERDKYAATLAACPSASYLNAFEIGCSIGILTRSLAERCDKLLAVDAAVAALDQARARCADLPHVTFARMHVPTDWPEGEYDLIVLSEVVYYLDRQDLGRLVEKIATVARGEIVLVHWLGLTDYPLAADEAVEFFIDSATPFAQPVHKARMDQYRLDVLTVNGAWRSDSATPDQASMVCADDDW